jgi:hypothetical protein
MDSLISKNSEKMRWIFFFMMFISIANTAHCYEESEVTCKEHARLLALTSKAEFAILDNGSLPKKLSSGTKMTAQEIRIRYRLLKSFLESLNVEILGFEKNRIIHKELSNIRSFLYQVILWESRGKYSSKVNSQIQASTQEIADFLADLTMSLSVVCTTPHSSMGGYCSSHSASGGSRSSDSGPSVSGPSASEPSVVESIALESTNHPLKSSCSSDRSNSQTSCTSSASLEFGLTSDPATKLTESTSLNLEAVTVLESIESLDIVNLSVEQLPSFPPPPPAPPPLKASWKSRCDSLDQILISLEADERVMPDFRNPSLYDSLGKPTVLNEFDVPDPFVYDLWNNWYLHGRAQNRFASSKPEISVPERVQQIFSSIFEFRTWLKGLASGSSFLTESTENKIRLDFLLKHAKAIAYFAQKMQRELVISDPELGLRFQIIKAETALTQAAVEAKKFISFKNDVEDQLTRCSLDEYLRVTGAKVKVSMPRVMMEESEKPSIQDQLKGNNLFQKRLATSLASEEAEKAKRFELFKSRNRL